MKATRAAFGEAIAQLGEKYDFVVMDADLTKSTRTDIFKEKFPERHINCGIAEANMISVAAGIASTGRPVFAASFAMFSVGRAFEPIRNSVGYPHLNVKIVGSHVGISVGEDGATHQCNEDIALMRAIPEMMIFSPCDEIETKECVKAALLHNGPCYIRTGRNPVPALCERTEIDFKPGKGIVVREGKDAVIIATGYMVFGAIEAAEMLEKEGMDVAVIDIHTIKPLDEKLVCDYAKKTGAVVTAEEHNIMGGLGSAVCEALCKSGVAAKTELVGMPDCYGKSGKYLELFKDFKMTAQDIANAVKRAAGR